MPPESWSGNEVATSSSPTRSSTSPARASRSGFADALDLEPEGDVVDHRAVGEQPEVLEDHRDRVAAQLAQLRRVGGHHVAAEDRDLAGGRLDQPDQRPHERRLARARQAHDDEHLAGPDLEPDVAHGDGVAGLVAQLGAREVRVRAADDPLGIRAEHLPDAARAEERLAAPVHRVRRLRRGRRGLRRLCAGRYISHPGRTLPEPAARAKCAVAPSCAIIRGCRRSPARSSPTHSTRAP